MRVKKFKYENDSIIQVYITNLEYKEPTISCKIDELKKENKVVIFISGELDTKEQLKIMVEYQKNP